MISLFVSILSFTLITALITFIILLFEAKFYRKSPVKIKLLNNDKVIESSSGANLLSTLIDNDLLLPSSCGGGGTCGLCKCKVLSGGGKILPTEESFIDRKMQKEHYRLACQVKVKNDMEIIIPEEVFDIQSYDCEVVSNNNVSTYIKELVIKIPENLTIDFKPGGYIQVEIPHFNKMHYSDFEINKPYQKEWENQGLFNLKVSNHLLQNRAYSMANYPGEGKLIKLNVRIALPPFNPKKNKYKNIIPGIASSYLFSLKKKDKIRIIGPYGDFFINKSDKEMIYIGGGAGMAPLRSHIFHLFNNLKTKRKVSFWYGARSERELFYNDDFKKIENLFDNFSFNVALSDLNFVKGWSGYTGFIHEVVYNNYLKFHKNPDGIEFYLCGPPLMIDSVLKMLDNFGIEKKNIFFDDFGS